MAAMPEFEVNPPVPCSICGELKEPEELSDLDGRLACLDCIAQANVAKNVPLEQLAAANRAAATSQTPLRRSKSAFLLLALLLLGIAAGGFYFWRVRHRQDRVRNSVTALKAEGDNLLRTGKLEEAIARYEAVLKQLQNKPLSDPQLVELYHQTEKSAAGPYLKMVQPKLERIEALLLADRSEEARRQFRELANFINAHSIQPDLSIRQRIDQVTDELRVPRIAKANWRKEIPTVTLGPAPRPTTIATLTAEPVAEPIPPPKPAVTNPNPSPQAQPQVVVTPAPKPIAPRPIEPVSVPDADFQIRALKQIRERFADKYAQPGPLARRALAHLLFITAQDTSDDMKMRYALLRESRDLAVRVPEPRIALAAVDEMSRSFLISDVAMRLSTIGECAQYAFTAESNELIAQSALDLADRMTAEKHYEEAYRCAVIANSAAQQSRDQSLIFQASGKLKTLKR
jgi:hypothetical protein